MVCLSKGVVYMVMVGLWISYAPIFSYTDIVFAFACTELVKICGANPIKITRTSIAQGQEGSAFLVETY